MAGLQSQGIGSGLDVKGLIEQLMKYERRPLTTLDTKEASYQAKLTAYGSLKGAVAGFQNTVKTLSSPSRMNTLKATAGDATLLSASTSSIAKPGSYNVEVVSLAQAQKLSSTRYDEATSTVGTGEIKIEFGTYDAADPPTAFTANPDKTVQTITIDSSQSTLTGVRDAINSAKAGVTASIVNDGVGYRLVLTSNDSGAANAMKITVTGDSAGTDTDGNGLSALVYNPASAVYNLDQDADNKAQNAEVKIDGITVTKNSNVISDAIQGVTLNLTKEGGPTTLKVATDSSGLKSALDAFIKAYNDLDTTFDDLGGYDAKTKKAGLLLGDTALRTIQSQVRNVLTRPLEGSGSGLNSLADIGLTLQRDGTLALDSTKLDKVLADPSKNVARLFVPMGVPTDGLIRYTSYTSLTKAGTYNVSLTQTASHGKAAASVAANTNIVAGNKELTLSVDGKSISVTLTTGNYSAATLATEMQQQINTALASSGKSVTVSQTAGKLTVTSASWGAASSVSVTGGTGLAALFGTPVSTAGTDVAGSIGGVAATGVGQVLTGNGDASGLELLVEGGSTGERGSVSFSSGYGPKLDSLLSNILDQRTGVITGKTSGVEQSIKEVGQRREVLSRRMEDIQKRYQAQFSALDSLVASMTQTSNFLAQQLANLPKASGD